MILDKNISIKIGSNNISYWKSKGYEIPFKVGGYGGKNGIKTILVNITDLPTKSNFYVSCRCDSCNQVYRSKFSNNTAICYFCFGSKKMKGNILGSINKGKPNHKQRGENHPRWNPNKSEFRKYRNQVNWLSEKQYADHVTEINPHNHPRTLCGVEGGYQLDHIKSVKEGFDFHITPEEISAYTNLQMLPWAVNLQKR